MLRRFLGRSKRGAWIADPNCESCEGSGKIYGGDIAVFNSRTMEVEQADDVSMCGCCEWDEPDPDFDRDDRLSGGGRDQDDE